jgi:hypothetical protein
MASSFESAVPDDLIRVDWLLRESAILSIHHIGNGDGLAMPIRGFRHGPQLAKKIDHCRLKFPAFA